MSDTVRFKHPEIDIPQLTPANRILEAARQLKNAIKQQPKRAPMEELKAIELLREVLLGEKKEKLPPNSVQTRKAKQKEVAPEKVSSKPATPVQTVLDNNASEAMPYTDAAYVSDDEGEEQPSNNPRSRRIRRFMAQHQENNKDGLHHIACLSGRTDSMPNLSSRSRIFTRGLGGANINLQMSEWAYEYFFQDQSLMKTQENQWNTKT